MTEDTVNRAKEENPWEDEEYSLKGRSSDEIDTDLESLAEKWLFSPISDGHDQLSAKGKVFAGFSVFLFLCLILLGIFFALSPYVLLIAKGIEKSSLLLDAATSVTVVLSSLAVFLPLLTWGLKRFYKKKGETSGFTVLP